MEKQSIAPISYEDAKAEILVSELGPEQNIAFPEISGCRPEPARMVHFVAPKAYVVRLRDVYCLPQGLLMTNEGLLPDTFRRGNPDHWHRHLNIEDGLLSLKKPVDKWQTYDEPCFYLDGEHASHFGHLTLEVVSRLWPLLDCEDIKSRKFVTSSKLTKHVLTVLRAFGITEDQLFELSVPTRFSDMIVASQSFVLSEGVNPKAFKVWEKIGSFYSDNSLPKQIYLSRLDTRKQRNLTNEAEIANYFCLNGFTNVYPAALSPEMQIAMFAGALDIAGPSGSNIYGAIYALNKGRRLLFAPRDFIKKDEAFIAHATQSFLKIAAGPPSPGEESSMLADWHIDRQTVVDAADQLFINERNILTL